ncbi:MAG: hypothetical protein IKU32_05600 [Clostridia bacterium]|nr:hypothetical protein [Clostridia bacterium]
MSTAKGLKWAVMVYSFQDFALAAAALYFTRVMAHAAKPTEQLAYYLSIPTHRPSKKLLPYGRSARTNGVRDNNHTVIFRISNDFRPSSSP